MVWSCCLKEQLKKSEKIFKLIKCFFSDLYDFNYTGGQAESNEGENGDDEKITRERVVMMKK